MSTLSDTLAGDHYRNLIFNMNSDFTTAEQQAKEIKEIWKLADVDLGGEEM